MKIKNPGNINNYIIKNDIGEGTFGKLKLVIYKPTGDEYAMKILNKQTIKEKMKNIDFKENEIIIKLHHINIVNCFELIENKENFYIIMEYCQKGELSDYIEENKKLSEDESSMFFYQLINGVNYIHKKGISHRDLKPENLLLTKDKILKIIDFGLSHEYDGNIFLKTKCGSPCYAAPEIIKGNNYDGFQIDVWCCGIVLYNMVCGDVPFEGETNKELFKNIIECEPEYPDFLSDDCKKIIKSILVNDPKRRITIEKIKESEFYLKGKKLCKINYEIDLDELDKKSYNIKIVKNIYENQKGNIQNKEKNNEKTEINFGITNKSDNIKNILNRKEINKEILDIKNKETQITDDEKNNILFKKIENNVINSFEKKDNDILFKTIRDQEMINKYSINNTPSKPRNKINKALDLFYQRTIGDNKLSENITNQKSIINEDNCKENKNILKTESNDYPVFNIKNRFKLKLNLKPINDEYNKKSINTDFHSKYNNLLKKHERKYKLLDINSNKNDKIMNKLIMEKDDNNNINKASFNPNQSLKLNKKVILDNNNVSNNLPKINAIKDKINYLTMNNFEFNNIFKNKSVNSKKFVKQIPPIKDNENFIICESLNNDSKKNNNNNNFKIDLNINDNIDNFNSLNKLNNANFIKSSSEKIKLNMKNIYNQNQGNSTKFRNYIINNNNEQMNDNKNESKSLKKNVDFSNNNQRYNNFKPKINLNKLITNYQNKNTLKNSFDLSNNKEVLLHKEIFRNYNKVNDFNSNSIHHDFIDNQISKTLNNNISTYYNENNDNKPEKITQYLNFKKSEEKTLNFMKKNVNNNTSGDEIDNNVRKNHNISKIHKEYKSIEDRNKIKKIHKYKIAIKEFLNFIETSYTSNANNLNSSGNNKKGFLPYL